MQLNLSSLRLGGAIAGVLVLGLYFAMGGSFSNPAIVQIEFGIDPHGFEGLTVEIDGEAVGKLEQIGQATRSGFEVEPGEHEVRVVGDGMRSETVRVELRGAGDKVRLMLDFAGYSEDDETLLSLY